MDLGRQRAWVMQDISPQRCSLKFNGYISYQTGGPLATQCDNAALFHLFFYLTGNKFVFIKRVFFIDNLQRRALPELHSCVHELHKDNAQRNPTKDKRVPLGSCNSSGRCDTKAQISKIVRPPARSRCVCPPDVTYENVIGDNKREAVCTQLWSATLIRAFMCPHTVHTHSHRH